MARYLMENQASLWDLATREPLWRAQVHAARLARVAFGARGQVVYAAATEEPAELVELDAATGARRRAWPLKWRSNVAVSPDGARAAFSDGYVLTLLDLGPDAPEAQEAQRPGPVWSLATARGRDGVDLVFAGYEDGVIRQWRGDAADPAWTYERHDRAAFAGAVRAASRTVIALALAPDARTLLSAGWDFTVRAWDLAAGGEQGVLARTTHGATVLAVSPDGALAAWTGPSHPARSGGPAEGSLLTLRDLARGRVLGSSEEPSRRTMALGFDARGELVQVFENGMVRGLSAATCEVRWSLTPPASRWCAAAVVLAGRDAIARVHDRRAWLAPIRDAAGPTVEFDVAEGSFQALAASPDERLLAAAAADPGRVYLWDLEARALVDTIDLASSHDSATRIAFSPDGGALYVGTRRGVVLRLVLRNADSAAG